MRKIIITIDGFSSCGKSTLAKQLAKQLNYIFIDSGAMYRAITVYFLRHHTELSSQEAVLKALSQIQLDFMPNAATGNSDIYLNGENVELLIREMTVAENVSNVAAVKEVRHFAVAAQQAMGTKKGIVMDGRDIGTTVFPNAELKLFMTADNAVRVKRRYEELAAKNSEITLQEVKENLDMRDYIDSHREVSPLRKADDAIVIDNTNLSPQEQLNLALQEVKRLVEAEKI